MKKDDIIVFKYEGITLEYTVYQGPYGCFLTNKIGGLNRQIFTLLKIEDRFAFCANVIGYTITDTHVDFPVIKTLEDLEKIVNALYQRIIDISTPKFKKGERVKIVPKCGPKANYPFGYTTEMEKLTNTTTTICGLEKISSVDMLKRCMRLEKYEEPVYYILKGNEFTWVSSMLEPVNEDETTSEPRDLSVMQKESVELYDAIKTGNISLPPGLIKTDINAQTVVFGGIKTMTDTILFSEKENVSKETYKLNFNVKPLKI